MTGEVFRFGVPRWFVTQIVRISQWTPGYNPPRVSRGKGYLHFRIGDFEVRNWKALT